MLGWGELGCVAVLLGQDRGRECWVGLLCCDAWLGGLGCLVGAMVLGRLLGF